MAIEVSPSARGFLVALGIVLVLALWMFSSGAFTTLVALAAIVGIVLFLLWACGVRVSRWFTGVS